MCLWQRVWLDMNWHEHIRKNKMIVIETDRLILREYVVNDWEAVHIYAQQEKVLKYEMWGPNSIQQTKAFIEKSITSRKENPRRNFELCIILKNTGDLIGGVGFRLIKRNSKRGNLGFIINPEYWEKGYATEASLGLLSYMIQNYNITEIEASCHIYNRSSERVLEKCRLKKTKKIKNDLETNGKFQEFYYFEKIITLPVEKLPIL